MITIADQQLKQKTQKTKSRHSARYKLLGKHEKNKIRRIARHVRYMRRRGHIDKVAEMSLADSGGQKVLAGIRDRYHVISFG